LPKLRLSIRGENGTFTHDGGSQREIFYQKEADRGYDSRGLLWSPGYFRVNVLPQRHATLIASAEAWKQIQALNPEEAFAADSERRRRLLAMAAPKARTGPAAELVLAA